MANLQSLKSECVKAFASVMLVTGLFLEADVLTNHFQPLSERFNTEKLIKATQAKALAKKELTERDKDILRYASARQAEMALGIGLLLGSLAIGNAGGKRSF